MAVTAFRDPGIIPRNLDPDPPCVLGDTPFEAGRHALADPEDPMAIPVQRVLRIRGTVVKVKWCETCGTYRPPRSSHCRCVRQLCREHRPSLHLPQHVYWEEELCVVHGFLARFDRVGAVRGRMYRCQVDTPNTSCDLPISTRGCSARVGLQRGVGGEPRLGDIVPALHRSHRTLLVLFTYHVRLVLLNRSTVEQIRINTAREYGEHKDLELGTHGDQDCGVGVWRRRRKRWEGKGSSKGDV